MDSYVWTHLRKLTIKDMKQPSRLGLQNIPTIPLQRGKHPINDCPRYDTKQSDG